MKTLIEVPLVSGQRMSWSAPSPFHRIVCEEGFISHIRWQFERTKRKDPHSGVARVLRGEGRAVVFQNEPETTRMCYVVTRLEDTVEITELIGDLELFPEFALH